MKTYWYKALRDVRQERSRSIAVIASLSMGIASFFAVLTTYAVLIDALNTSYRETNPAAATLDVGRLSAGDLAAVRQMPEVLEAERRRVIHGRVRAGAGGWKNLVLFVREDLAASRIGTVDLEEGQWPGEGPYLSIERDALQVVDVAVGQSVSLLTVSGKEAKFTVTGSVHEVGLAQARMENLVYAYTRAENLPALGEVPGYDKLVLSVSSEALSRKQIEEVAAKVAHRLEGRGVKIGRTRVPRPGKHPHALIMGVLLATIAMFGLFVVVLSGAITFNVMTALLMGQSRQIGVMKALGGTRSQIASSYWLSALFLGAASVTLALPVGYLLGRLLTAGLAGFLNVDVDQFSVPLWAIGLAVVIGVALPVVAGVIPVVRGTAVSVRQSLSSRAGESATWLDSALNKLVIRITLAGGTASMSFRNLVRNRLRTLLTLMTLAISGTLFMSALHVRTAMIDTLDRLFEGRHADLSISLARPVPHQEAEQLVRAVPGVRLAEGWIVERARLSKAGGAKDAQLLARKEFELIGLPSETRLLALEVAERHPPSVEDGIPQVIINTELRRQLNGLHLGDVFHFRASEARTLSPLRIAGIAHEPFTRPRAYVDRTVLAESGGGAGSNTLKIDLVQSDTLSTEMSRGAIDAALKRAGMGTKGTRTKAETRFVLDQHMLMIYVFLLFASGLVAVVGLIGLMATMGLNISERRREMGILRAIGASPLRVAQILSLEGVSVGLLAWLLGALASMLIGKALGDALLALMFREAAILPLRVDFVGMGLWLLVSVGACYLASFAPAYLAARESVRDALAYE